MVSPFVDRRFLRSGATLFGWKQYASSPALQI
nr:MAG TPA: hypothetical protein [Caudoviricetes sp.]